ncbi:uncharacterized protein LOC119275080 isoform X2 [Triticum dicoccoides]|uniref:uncharacterized protein LOC119275080 isoform X2 n=1 Tax=Triticum dicoccoides TaxID=85692 RepID=UPI00188F8287|nr:uncharacterized protein LOC119275080 isoform X2 [Triticum dicoccoides]
MPAREAARLGPAMAPALLTPTGLSFPIFSGSDETSKEEGRSVGYLTRSRSVTFGCPVNQSPRSCSPKDLLRFGLPETSHVVSCNLLACVWRRDPTIVPFIVPILETVAAHYELPPPGYLCEVDGDGHVLVLPQRKFFGSPACLCFVDTYEQAALQAIKFCRACMAL